MSKSSKRIKLENRGFTYEDRPLILLTISSEKNLSRLEDLRKNHINLSKGKVTNYDLEKVPAIVYQGFSVHGNEASGSNAAVMLALLKVARTKFGNPTEDTYIDAAAYMAIAGECKFDE